MSQQRIFRKLSSQIEMAGPIERQDSDLGSVLQHNVRRDTSGSATGSTFHLSEKGLERVGKQQVHKVVLTGGPCAGKTTCLARLSAFLLERGFNVFTIPEAASIFWTNGATQFDDSTTEEQRINFQITLMNLQMSLENSFHQLALHGNKPAVLLCDRGLCDGAAYISDEEWDRVLAAGNMNMVEIRDKRYDVVLHLVTAANGAEDFYVAETGRRTEGIAEACALDQSTQNAWVGHPHLHVIDNSTNFDGKMERIVSIVGRLVGLPQSKKSTARYLMRGLPDLATLPVKYEEFVVDKIYLQGSHLQADEDSSSAAVEEAHKPHGPGEPCNLPDPREFVVYTFVRCRSQGGLSSYSSTTYVHILECENGQVNKRRLEKKTIISSRAYRTLVNQMADPDRNQLKQRRICFLWEGSYYTIVEYLNVKKGLCILYRQQTIDDHGEVVLPPFVDIERDVTNDKIYSSYNLSVSK